MINQGSLHFESDGLAIMSLQSAKNHSKIKKIENNINLVSALKPTYSRQKTRSMVNLSESVRKN